MTKIKSFFLAIGLAAATATGASAALLDFTEGLPGKTSGDLGGGVTWNLTAVGGTISTGFAYDGGNFFKNTSNGTAITRNETFALDNDGVGIIDDEVTNGDEALVLTFSKSIFLTAVHFLDLFIGDNGQVESAITYDADTNTMIVEAFANGNVAGYANKAVGGVGGEAVKSIRFVPGPGKDDGSADFALAGIEFSTNPDGNPNIVPLPAGGLLLVGALGGLAMVRRRKKA